jgi:hypothetical protein
VETHLPANVQSIDNPPKHEGPVKRLRRLTENALLLRSTDGRCYAQVSVGGRRETFAIRSSAFQDYLIDGYYRAHQELPSDWSMRRALRALEATARREGGTPSVFVRVGLEANGDGNGNGSTFYLDLADPAGHAVKFGPEGWSVVDNPPVHFRRPDGHLPLPIPARGGSLYLLRPFVNLTDRDFRLLIVWLAAALRPKCSYPILALYGQQGSAKSTLARIVRRLIDPQAVPLVAEPQNIRELVASAVSGWLAAYDNIGVIPRTLSDGLCLLATGGGLAGSASLASGERTVVHAQRPVILNGTEEFVGRGDLADRSVFLDLPPIAPCRRRCEQDFWEAFDQDYPRILGGLLDAVVGGLRELASVRLTELPRMADFARFAEAVGRSLGWCAGTVASDYNDNRGEATVTQLEDSPLASLLLNLGPDYLDGWSGSPTLLLEELTALAGKLANSPRWPKSPERLAKELRRIAPQLGMHGMLVSFTRRCHSRIVTLERIQMLACEDTIMRNPVAAGQL